MKGSKLKIVLISAAILFIIIGGATSYIVSTKIKPEEIRKIVLTELQKRFPQAKVELGKMDLGLGASISLDAKKFSITYPLKKNDIEIFSVDSLSVEIPILTILLGGGAIDIALEQPQVRYLDYKNDNLWQMAMAKKPGERTNRKEKRNKPVINQNNSSVSSQKEVGASSLVLPAFAINSSVNLSFNNINLEYGEVGAIAGKVDINKFVIKNLGLKKDAAYEVNSKIMLSQNKTETTSLKALLIGEFSLKNFLEKGEIKSKAVLTLSDIVVPSVDGTMPEIRNDIELAVHKNGNISLKLGGEFDKSNYKLNVKMNNKGIDISNIAVNLVVADLKNIVGSPMKMINPGKSKVNLNGSVRMVETKIYPNINYSTSSDMGIKLPDYSLTISSNGRISDKKITTSSTANIFDGSIDTGLVAHYDLNSKEVDFQKKIKSYIVNLEASNLKFSKSYLQKTLYPPKNKLAQEKKTTGKSDNKTSGAKPSNENKQISKTAPIPLLPNGKINLKAKKINLGGKSFNSSGLITTKGSAVVVKNLKVLMEQGEAALNSNVKMYKNSMKTKFDFEMKSIDIASFDGLMPEQHSGSHGVFSGKVMGTATSGKNTGFNVSVKVNGKNGELKGVDLKPYLEKVYQLAKKIPGLDKKIDLNKKVDYTGNFKKFSLDGNFKPNHYQLKSTEFIGLDNLIQAKANGNIYPETKRLGKVFADVVEDKYLSDYIEAYAGTKTIPVLFKGPGMTLNADYQYTVKKLSKRVLKKNKTKVKKKAKEEIKKGLDKLFKGKENKKIDKLLKGLF